MGQAGVKDERLAEKWKEKHQPRTCTVDGALFHGSLVQALPSYSHEGATKNKVSFHFGLSTRAKPGNEAS